MADLVYDGAFPFYSGGGTDSPGVASVEALDSTHVKVTFTKPAYDNGALRAVTTYEITCSDGAPTPLVVLSVAPEATTYPTYVTLTTMEQHQGTTYTMTLIRLIFA